MLTTDSISTDNISTDSIQAKPLSRSSSELEILRFPSPPRPVTMHFTQRWRRWIPDGASLQMRLTLGVAFCSLLGLSSMTIWTQWQLQKMLISNHKQTVDYLAQRFPKDLEFYSRNQLVEKNIQEAVNNISSSNTLVWVEMPNGIQITPIRNQNIVIATANAVRTMGQMGNLSTVYQVDNHYLVMCSQPLTIKGIFLGKVFFARDVTQENLMLMSSTQSLIVLSVLVYGLMVAAIAIYIHNALQPLRRISQMAEMVHAKDLESQPSLPVKAVAPTEVRELANTLNSMLMRLSQSWEQQRQFVSNVSHELRTPLTIVQGYLQSLLRRSQNLTEPQREALETATAETARTVRLLEVLLDLARADSGYMHFTLEPLRLQDFLAETVGMTAQYSERSIHLKAPEQPVWVMADRDRLKQVVINLLDNAIKYSAAEQPIILQVETVQKQGYIQVCDRGIGIPLSQQTRIFERFYRVDPARSPEMGGTGLGLSIVKTLVEGMGGSISVRSKPGEGSTFTIQLPLVPLN